MQLDTDADPADTAKQKEELTSNGHAKELEHINLCDDEHVDENGKLEPGDIDIFGCCQQFVICLVLCFPLCTHNLIELCTLVAQALHQLRRCESLG